ncbi:MAG: tetratricopeptide repeat protein [Bacteroidota bacterium]
MEAPFFSLLSIFRRRIVLHEFFLQFVAKVSNELEFEVENTQDIYVNLKGLAHKGFLRRDLSFYTFSYPVYWKHPLWLESLTLPGEKLNPQQASTILTASYINSYVKFATFYAPGLTQGIQEAYEIVELEFLNLKHAYFLALRRRNSFIPIYYILDVYLSMLGKHSDRVFLALRGLENYHDASNISPQESPQEELSLIDGLANAYASLKQFSKAEKLINGNIDFLSKLDEGTLLRSNESQARIWNNLGYIHLDLQHFDQSEYFLNKAFQASNQFDDKELSANILTNLGSLKLEQGDFERSKNLYLKSLALYQSMDHRASMAEVLRSLGIVSFYLNGKDEPSQYFENALNILKDQGNLSLLAEVYRDMGIFAQYQGNYAMSASNFQQSLEIYLQVEDSVGEAQQLYNLGYLALLQEEWDDSQSYYQKALTIYEGIEDYLTVGDIFLELGNIYFEQSRLDEALKATRKVLVLYKEYGNSIKEADILQNMGNLYYAMDKPLEAQEFYQRALGQHRSNTNTFREAEVFQNLAVLHSSEGKMDLAMDHYYQAIRLFSEQQEISSLIYVLGNINNLLVGQEAQLGDKLTEYTQKVLQAIPVEVRKKLQSVETFHFFNH